MLPHFPIRATIVCAKADRIGVYTNVRMYKTLWTVNLITVIKYLGKAFITEIPPMTRGQEATSHTLCYVSNLLEVRQILEWSLFGRSFIHKSLLQRRVCLAFSFQALGVVSEAIWRTINCKTRKEKYIFLTWLDEKTVPALGNFSCSWNYSYIHIQDSRTLWK